MRQKNNLDIPKKNNQKLKNSPKRTTNISFFPSCQQQHEPKQPWGKQQCVPPLHLKISDHYSLLFPLSDWIGKGGGGKASQTNRGLVTRRGIEESEFPNLPKEPQLILQVLFALEQEFFLKKNLSCFLRTNVLQNVCSYRMYSNYSGTKREIFWRFLCSHNNSYTANLVGFGIRKYGNLIENILAFVLQNVCSYI